MKIIYIVLGLAVVAAVGLLLPNRNDFSVANAAGPELTTMPEGITFQTVGARYAMALNGSFAGYSVLADSTGRTLYTSERDPSGKSACNADCAKEWPMLAAPSDAKPSGLWQPIARDDGTKQWAFRGKPLYTYAGDQKVGDFNGRSVEGWHFVPNQAMDGVELPDGITTAEMVHAGGQVFVDAHKHALYVYSGDVKDDTPRCAATKTASGANAARIADCQNHWQPFLAGQVANNLGDFTVVDRPDGSRQWAYMGRPLYTFDLDIEKDDANGRDLDPRWSVALAERYFLPPGIQFRKDARGFDILAKEHGMTIYTRDQFYYQDSGFSSRGGQKGIPSMGQALGASACADECTKSYPPVLAPESAKSSGYWNIVMRADGRKQWSYQGYALYTYIGDKTPGDATRHDEWDLSTFKDVPQTGSPIESVSALYWREVFP